jgi:hypothetical protein
MNNSRIIISADRRIKINAQDVCFGITRECSQVELKNINIFSNKNHLCRSGRNGKTFLLQALLHNFVQFLA